MGCDDGAILTLSENSALAPGNHKLGIVGNLGFLSVESLVLDHDGGVVVADGGAEKTDCVLGGGGHCDLKAGEVHKGVSRLWEWVAAFPRPTPCCH